MFIEMFTLHEKSRINLLIPGILVFRQIISNSIFEEKVNGQASQNWRESNAIVF